MDNKMEKQLENLVESINNLAKIIEQSSNRLNQHEGDKNEFDANDGSDAYWYESDPDENESKEDIERFDENENQYESNSGYDGSSYESIENSDSRDDYTEDEYDADDYSNEFSYSENDS